MTPDFTEDIVAVNSIRAIPTILDIVCRTTGMRFAAVARVTEDRWIACSVRAVAIEALTSLFAHTIRIVHDYDPDHSGPENEAEEYSRAMVDATLTLLSVTDYRGDLPRMLLTQAVPTA